MVVLKRELMMGMLPLTRKPLRSSCWSVTIVVVTIYLSSACRKIGPCPKVLAIKLGKMQTKAVEKDASWKERGLIVSRYDKGGRLPLAYHSLHLPRTLWKVVFWVGFVGCREEGLGRLELEGISHDLVVWGRWDAHLGR